MGNLAAGVAGLSFEESLRFDEEQRAAVEPQELPPWACACVSRPALEASVSVPLFLLPSMFGSIRDAILSY